MKYLEALGSAADKAFRTMPELAVQLAFDMLTDKNEGRGAIAHQLKPADDTYGEAYRTAFTAAWRILDPKLPVEKTLYPCISDADLVEELGMAPVEVKSAAVRNILRDAGAFKDITDHVYDMLINSRRAADPIPGFERLRRAMSRLLPTVDSSSIVLRDYRFSQPKIVWEAKSKAFSVAVPDECGMHPEGDCLCWVGPCLSLAIKSWSEPGTERPSAAAMWRAFMWAMDGVVDMREPQVEPSVEPDVDGMGGLDGGRYGPEDFQMGNDSGDDEDEDDNRLLFSRRTRRLNGIWASPARSVSGAAHTDSEALPTTTYSPTTGPSSIPVSVQSSVSAPGPSVVRSSSTTRNTAAPAIPSATGRKSYRYCGEHK